MKTALAIGLMSGSSLDGLDMALVRFTSDKDAYTFNILKAETVPYPQYWHDQLADAYNHTPEDLVSLDMDYGAFLGRQVASFVERHGMKPDFVASHGHTVFHKPEQHFTLQIGNGQALADACGLTVINDFRTEDVGKGGQGAPLVPVGDKLLFDDYELCLNIGGIANVSYELKGQRIAYDICIANQALNWLAQREGLCYDKDGLMARHGSVDLELLQMLNGNAFFQKTPPKSLGREFFETYQKALLQRYVIPEALATFVEHIAFQIAQSVEAQPQGKMLVTGGGARNRFLIERIQSHTKQQVVVPDPMIIDYKEALVFALLGLLRLEGRVNVLCSVTGAPTDSSSGKIWHPTSKLQ